MDITNQMLVDFVYNEMDWDRRGFINDVGHLLIPDDSKINDEALRNLKLRLKKYTDLRGK